MKDIKAMQQELAKQEEIIKEVQFQSIKILETIFDICQKENRIIKEILKPNLCLYCKSNKTDSIDPNVLCLKCRETFGHSFFNEL